MSKVQKEKTHGLQSATVAVYSLKGGFGKTTFAVNLACASARISRRRTLLWDLDLQAASTWLMTDSRGNGTEAQSVFARSVDARSLCRPSRFERADDNASRAARGSDAAASGARPRGGWRRQGLA